ncbi:MerR family transcriptional regulator [Bacillus halotolerans]|uniref:MerR family transcriptional regulator n=1 Tax=Bacillus halotolerans TaxID=260554 RepID=UPI000D015D25|nr:MerR family transcriptional regulator [Bacillus halotolerans]MDP4525214.1 MerR family transcriptional regulator [Bacillus halotolerans]PRP52766.1 MerR family transcriptional regulator [Bacillus halotolerans]PRP60269.1 MerR family transcriptional regulator [Bacillus halotolerans]PRP64934.1 MerR family transcriptional regulator [Bacillus halotolerans]
MNITQVAKQFGLTAATLRYYERVGLIPPVKRKDSGIRDYDEEDIKWVEFIKCMRNAGLTIEALIEYTTLFTEGDRTVEARKNILADERQRLIEKRKEIDETIKRLNKKIEDYDGKLRENEDKLKSRPKTESVFMDKYQ